MKSVLFTLVIFLTIIVQKCSKQADQSILPCIQSKIDLVKKMNPRAEVYEYRYNGKKVFYFTNNCCDQYNMLYDEDCNPVCAPSGGITGKGDMKCTDFNVKAEQVRLVWKHGLKD
jgi:hypothetical protein